ncbi:DHCW motif cupin fold protein [Dokdonella sp.]|uniref:DHCW motif cupin fold protein n=1 Tax=Dokdonella sp. TaxID=2291710 RepID=UPI002F4143D8
MQMPPFAFDTTDWMRLEPTGHAGASGTALWRTREFGAVRVRLVAYTPGYRADHGCSKGHILFCVEGELQTELEDGRRFTLAPGMSHQVGDGAEPHLSSTTVGARLIVD